MYLAVDLPSEDRHLRRRLNAAPHLLAHDREHRDLYFVPDHDALVGLSRQNQHSGCTFLFADWPPRREPHPPSVASIVRAPGESDTPYTSSPLAAGVPRRLPDSSRPITAIGTAPARGRQPVRAQTA